MKDVCLSLRKLIPLSGFTAPFPRQIPPGTPRWYRSTQPAEQGLEWASEVTSGGRRWGDEQGGTGWPGSVQHTGAANPGFTELSLHTEVTEPYRENEISNSCHTFSFQSSCAFSRLSLLFFCCFPCCHRPGTVWGADGGGKGEGEGVLCADEVSHGNADIMCIRTSA